MSSSGGFTITIFVSPFLLVVLVLLLGDTSPIMSIIDGLFRKSSSVSSQHDFACLSFVVPPSDPLHFFHGSSD